MAMNIKDPQTESLAAEVAALTRETKTGAIRTALREKRDRLLATGTNGKPTYKEMIRFLEEEIWSQIPPDVLDQPPLTKAEREAALGYGPGGV